MNPIEAAVTAALAALTALAAFAVLVAVLTIGGPGLALFAVGVLVGWALPHSKQ